MSKRTPGKWVKDFQGTKGHIKALVYSGERETPSVCKYHRGFCADSITEEEMQANGHLLAAAPDMLEALKCFVQSWSEGRFLTDGYTVLKSCRDAIDKAEGKFVCSRCGDCLTGHEDESGMICRWCVTSQPVEATAVAPATE